MEATQPGFQDLLTDALRYWEPRRIVYNAALFLVVVGRFVSEWPASAAAITFDGFVSLFILGVLANVAYCAAYVVDLGVQHSTLREAWRPRRKYLLLVGVLFGCALAYFISRGLSMPSAAN
jgi:hypothetical protein